MDQLVAENILLHDAARDVFEKNIIAARPRWRGPSAPAIRVTTSLGGNVPFTPRDAPIRNSSSTIGHSINRYLTNASQPLTPALTAAQPPEYWHRPTTSLPSNWSRADSAAAMLYDDYTKTTSIHPAPRLTRTALRRAAINVERAHELELNCKAYPSLSKSLKEKDTTAVDIERVCKLVELHATLQPTPILKSVTLRPNSSFDERSHPRESNEQRRLQFLDQVTECVVPFKWDVKQPKLLLSPPVDGTVVHSIASEETITSKQSEEDTKRVKSWRQKHGDYMKSARPSIVRRPGEPSSRATSASGNPNSNNQIEQWLHKSNNPKSKLPRKVRKKKPKADTQDGIYDHEQVIAVLKKQPHERTKADNERLFRNCKNLKAFSKLSSFVLHELCGVFLYNYMEEDRVVFRQGDVGTSWYVILKGAVDVKISATGSLADARTVVQMSAGAGFGDLALVNDKPRSATIITVQPCEFARVEKADYNRILRFIHEKDCKEKALFMKKLRIFESWSLDSLKSVADVIKWKKFEKGSNVMEEGQMLKEIYIVRSGTCVLLQTLTLEDFEKQVVVETYGEGEFFGEALLTGSAEERPCTFTLRAESEVEVAVVNAIDALANFRVSEMELKAHGEPNVANLIELYKDTVRKKKWSVYRRNFLSSLAVERGGHLQHYLIKKNVARKKNVEIVVTKTS